ncbi:MAG: LLM class flavin-dependent oxidoreductase [Brevundimonas sp.]|uniref:LLM class flavin-dependent oxidoreductase n=1 Tax=Brevundimonas albigilva TaxID=1312364 RepID=A0ABY4SK82_9CAUL|nr:MULTISPECIES: LLM class flavin-dependent oxidoreductase [Brevundimonas]PZU56268.1 MAG: LLM class flavin-dependent oxidoreductase [Brevundimonas sp.]URI14669.1 LLM class flavin-dependent oxidoreductase [Brevundimonas albigilva]
MIPFSVLDLSPIVEGGDARRALDETLSLAQAADRLGYERFWLAEHHNMPGIASAATAIVIGHVAAGTARIRVGSGGVMLPNHAPLVVAEQFGTLETLFPGRIDLGLGRAPGTDGATARALRRYFDAADQFPRDVAELIHWFEPETPGQAVRAVPGAGLRVPIWLLGSSLFSAQLAGQLGLPYAFASHFAPELLLEALALYRRSFEPSDRLDKPYAMAAINVFAADTDEEGVRLSTSMQQSFARLTTGKPGKLPPPVDDIASVLTPQQIAGAQSRLLYSAVGGPDTVRRKLADFIALTGVDELMVTGMMHDNAARIRSLEIVADARAALDAADAA